MNLLLSLLESYADYSLAFFGERRSVLKVNVTTYRH